MGLDPEDKRLYHKYSLGMKQRLGIAQSIMEQPDLLILDEPTSAIDEEGVKFCLLYTSQFINNFIIYGIAYKYADYIISLSLIHI